MGLLKRIERAGRRRAAESLSAFLSGESAELPREPSTILVIRTDSRLGNLVLLEPLLRSLRLRFPEARLSILASDTFSSILEIMGYEVIPVDKKGQIKKPWKFLRLVSKLQSADYDVAIDAAHPHSFSLSGAISARLSGACCTLSTDAGESRGWYTCVVPEPSLKVHESRALHSLGSLWADWPQWSPPGLKGPCVPQTDAVGFHTGASGSKAYPVEKMDELVRGLSHRLELRLYWGNPRELEIARRLASRYTAALMPKLSIGELVESISGLRMFITADNGPMHLASALGIPVTALFRVDNAQRFRPLSEGSQVLMDPNGPDPEEVAGSVFKTLGLY